MDYLICLDMDQFTNLLKYGPHIYNVVMDHWSIIWTHWTALNTNANVLLRCIIPPEPYDASPLRLLPRMVGRDGEDCPHLQRVHHDCSQVTFSLKQAKQSSEMR